METVYLKVWFNVQELLSAKLHMKCVHQQFIVLLYKTTPIVLSHIFVTMVLKFALGTQKDVKNHHANLRLIISNYPLLLYRGLITNLHLFILVQMVDAINMDV